MNTSGHLRRQKPTRIPLEVVASEVADALKECKLFSGVGASEDPMLHAVFFEYRGHRFKAMISRHENTIGGSYDNYEEIKD